MVIHIELDRKLKPPYNLFSGKMWVWLKRTFTEEKRKDRRIVLVGEIFFPFPTTISSQNSILVNM